MTIAPARNAVEDVADAIDRFNSSPNDLGVRLPGITGGALASLDRLADLNEQPRAFAWALRQLDQGRVSGPVLVGDPTLFTALISARLGSPFATDREVLAQALTAQHGLPFEEAGVLSAMLGVAEQEGWAGELRAFLFGDLANFWAGDEGTMPWGKGGAGLFRTLRAPGYMLSWFFRDAIPDAPTSMNGGLSRFIGKLWPAFDRLRQSSLIAGTARGSNLFARGQSLRTLPPRAGLIRSLGVVGGVISTAQGLADLMTFDERPTEYAADVAETLFSASSTAFFIAPNPYTAGATLVTGAAWLGLEAWNHRDEIAQAASTAWNTTTEATSDLWDSATGVAGRVASALNPFD